MDDSGAFEPYRYLYESLRTGRVQWVSSVTVLSRRIAIGIAPIQAGGTTSQSEARLPYGLRVREIAPAEVLTQAPQWLQQRLIGSEEQEAKDGSQ